MGTISLCITASRDEGSVRALLELIRPAVDEVVLGVDARAAERILAACGDLVDRPYVYEFETTVERYVPWLFQRCRGDWIMRFDDDEVPGRDLLGRLPQLAEDRRRSVLLMPVRNLFPTRDRFIVSHPWYPEYRPRLVRNVPGLWTFSGSCHSTVEVLGERRRVPEAPVYHLHHAEPELELRLATARARERQTPRLMTEAYRVNALPVPELWSGVETAAVPVEDRAAIERVAVPPPPPTATPGAAEAIPIFEAERSLIERTVPADAYRAEIEISKARLALAAGTIAHLEVHVRNEGSERWPPAHQQSPLIRLAYRWLAADGETVLEPEGLRTPFEETVMPGERTVAMLAVQVPDEPGRYVLEVDVVHELVSWFGCEARIELAVEPFEGPSLDGSPGFARADLERIGLDAVLPPEADADAGGAESARVARSGWGALRRLRAPRRSTGPSG